MAEVSSLLKRCVSIYISVLPYRRISILGDGEEGRENGKGNKQKQESNETRHPCACCIEPSFKYGWAATDKQFKVMDFSQTSDFF